MVCLANLINYRLNLCSSQIDLDHLADDFVETVMHMGIFEPYSRMFKRKSFLILLLKSEATSLILFYFTLQRKIL